MSEGLYNAADPAAIRSAAKAARQADRTKEEILRGIMSVPSGRAWMLSLIYSCGVFQTTFTGDAQKTAFNEGKRSVGNELMSGILVACPDQFFLAMREQREQNERTTNSTGRNGYDSGSADGPGNGNGGYTTAESVIYSPGDPDDLCGNE